MKLFDTPFDLDDIDDVLRNDWPRFGAVAFASLGRPGAWDRAVTDLGQLFDGFAAAAKDDQPLYELFDLLIAHCAGRQDRRERLTRFATALGFAGVSTRIDQVLQSATKDPDALQRERNEAWLREYRAKADLKRAAREALRRSKR